MITFKVEDLKNMNAQLKAFSDFLRSLNVSEDDVFLCRLVSCELIANVIRHGGEAADFTGELLSDKISITVTAESQKNVNLTPPIPDVFAESGRGLYIINAVSLNGINRGERGELRVYIKRTHENNV